MNIDKYLRLYSTGFLSIGVALILTTSFVSAQDIRDISLTNGLQRFAGKDLGYSPLKYTGMRSVISLNYLQENDSRIESLSLSFSQGVVASREGNSMDNWSVNLISHTLFNPAHNNEKKVLFGWSLQNEFNQRIHQSFSNFNDRMDYFTAIGPAIGCLFPISGADTKLRWKTTAHMQGIGLKIASDFISSEPRVSELGGNVAAGTRAIPEIFRIGRDWSLGCWSEIRYESNTGNSMAIQHQFDFQQLSVAQDVIHLRNSFMINISVRL